MLELEEERRTSSAKPIYASWGVRHVSIDLNGRDGALVIDLDQPVPTSMVGMFDVVTNYGTLEHVINQFQAFKNVHDLCRTRGVMIHAFPPPGQWVGHGRYYYPEPFATGLARVCKYDIISLVTRCAHTDAALGLENRDLISVAYVKSNNNSFVERSQFAELPLVDSGDLTNTGNSDLWGFRMKRELGCGTR